MNTGGPCRCPSGGQPVNIRKRNFTGSARESELPILPLGSQGQHNLGRGKGQCFHRVSEEEEGRRLPFRLKTPEKSGNFGGNYTKRPSRSCESHWKKMIGKPYSGKPTVRFDEGELEIELTATTPTLYSTAFFTPNSPLNPPMINSIPNHPRKLLNF